MDVHRSRFVPYPTSAISSLAFSRSSDSGYQGPLPALKLAIGRANGDVEIWNPQGGSWVQETVFLGDGRSIDGLQWTQEPYDTDADGQVITGKYRLFSIASSPSVTEWDLTSGTPKRRSTGNFSEAWCFAAQPRLASQQSSTEEVPSQDLVVGCGDGTLVLLSTADNDLQFKRFLARVSGKKARCMCITYQTRDRVVAGFADSMIRIYDTRNNLVVRAMSLGVAVPGAPKNALVWQIRCLPNGDIVSGDSNGELRIWDGKTYSQAHRITGHDTDCLDLITSGDGYTIFSGSIDGKIAVYRRSISGGRKTWARSSQRRVHNGEVKAMAAFDSRQMSVVVSGGGDVAPMVTPLRGYGEENLRSLPSLPQTSPVTSAPKARLLVSWWEKSVYIWRIGRNSVDTAIPEKQRPRKLVARMNLDTKDSVQSVSITSDGRVLAASTSTEVKVFQLRKRIDHDSLAIRKLAVPQDLSTSGARLLSFSPNGKWLAAISPESEVYMARIAQHVEKPKHLRIVENIVELDRREQRTSDQSAFKDYERTISRVAFSPDSTVLVTSDLSGYLDCWVLEGSEDVTAPAVSSSKHHGSASYSDSDSDSDSDGSDDDETEVTFYGQHWTQNPSGQLPKLDASPLVLTFRPTTENTDKQTLSNGHSHLHLTDGDGTAYTKPHQPQHRLWIMTTKHQMYEFDILSARLSDWSRRNPSAALPEAFTKIRDRVMGGMWDCQGRIWLYGSSFVCMLDVSKDLDASANLDVVKRRRRKAKDADASTDDEAVHKRRKLESGAGGKIDDSHKTGLVRKVKRLEDGTWTDIELDNAQNRLQDDDDDDDEEDFGFQLTRLRSSEDEQAVAKDEGHQRNEDRRWWCSFKYRPILGMVPLSDEDVSLEDGPLEVVLVERPAWDT